MIGVHRGCGGAVLGAGNVAGTYTYCDRCSAYAFGGSAVPSGKDRAANLAALDGCALRSPPERRAPGAGRKPRDPGGERSDVATTVRLTAAGRAAVDRAAELAGVTASVYMAGVVTAQAVAEVASIDRADRA